MPAVFGGSGRRGARLGVHGNTVARKATGLEAALVDHAKVRLSSLDPADPRSYDVSVAGVAALLVWKLHKIAERNSAPGRLKDKDGLDTLRLLRFADTDILAGTLKELAAHPVAGEVTQQAREFLQELFGDRTGVGTQLAVAASAGTSYDDLPIADGQTAAQSFLTAEHGECPKAERAALRQALKDYCRRDTEVMVQIVERLRQFC